jgi:hypothetical protein
VFLSKAKLASRSLRRKLTVIDLLLTPPSQLTSRIAVQITTEQLRALRYVFKENNATERLHDLFEHIERKLKFLAGNLGLN